MLMRHSTAVMVCALGTVAFQGLTPKAEAAVPPSGLVPQPESTEVAAPTSFAAPDPIAAVSPPESSHDTTIALTPTHLAAASSTSSESLEVAQVDVSTLPNPPVATVQINTIKQPPTLQLPSGFKLPIGTLVATDRTIQTDNPITDNFASLARGDRTLSRPEYTSQITTWAERIRECMLESPRLVSVQTDGTLMPIVLNGNQGKVMRNANQRLVCTS